MSNDQFQLDEIDFFRKWKSKVMWTSIRTKQEIQFYEWFLWYGRKWCSSKIVLQLDSHSAHFKNSFMFHTPSDIPQNENLIAISCLTHGESLAANRKCIEHFQYKLMWWVCCLISAESRRKATNFWKIRKNVGKNRIPTKNIFIRKDAAEGFQELSPLQIDTLWR